MRWPHLSTARGWTTFRFSILRIWDRRKKHLLHRGIDEASSRGVCPQELVIKLGEPTEKMYLLQHEVLASRGRIISSGNFIGDDFVLHAERRRYAVRAITYVDVFSLSKEDLERLSRATICHRLRARALVLYTAFPSQANRALCEAESRATRL